MRFALIAFALLVISIPRIRLFLKNIFSPAIRDEWTISEGERDGLPMIVRFNAGLRSVLGDKRYPFRVGIAVPLQSPQPGGLPSSEENLALNDIEDEIINLFNNHQRGFLSAVITTNAMKEYMVYSRTDTVADIIDALNDQFPGYAFQHYVARDEAWEGYKNLIPV